MRCKMNVVAQSILAISIVLPTFGGIGAKAQGLPNFVQNEENKIQQDSATGLLNKNQTSNLQNQEAQIMQQENQYANQNGGTLTPQERQQLGQETRSLNQSRNYDMQRNNPNAAVQPTYGWQGGGQAGRPNGWNPWGGNNQNSQPQAQNWQNNPNFQQAIPNGQQQTGNGPHHHHRDWANNGNGTYNGNGNGNYPNNFNGNFNH